MNAIYPIKHNNSNKYLDQKYRSSENVKDFLDREVRNGYPYSYSTRYLNESFKNITEWLNTVGFSEYVNEFVDNGYDIDIAVKMSAQDLIAIGISNPYHRKTLKTELSKLEVPEDLQYEADTLEDWLNAVKLSEYACVLASQNIFTINDISQICVEDLEDVGIHKLGHQKRFLLAIKKLSLRSKIQRDKISSKCSSYSLATSSGFADMDDMSSAGSSSPSITSSNISTKLNVRDSSNPSKIRFRTSSPKRNHTVSRLSTFISVNQELHLSKINQQESINIIHKNTSPEISRKVSSPGWKLSDDSVSIQPDIYFQTDSNLQNVPDNTLFNPYVQNNQLLDYCIQNYPKNYIQGSTISENERFSKIRNSSAVLTDIDLMLSNLTSDLNDMLSYRIQSNEIN